MSHSILVIEDESTLAKNIKRYLEKHGHEVATVGTGEAGIEAIEGFQPDIVLLDYQLPEMDGLEVLKRIHTLNPAIKVIMITAHGGVELAVQAIKQGAYDFLCKPLALGELNLLIDRAAGQEKLEGALSYYRRREPGASGVDAILGQSKTMKALKGDIRQLLNSEAVLTDDDAPAVLITGETGTGKELVARAIHFGGRRREGPFIEVNCAALPEHLVEAELFGYERGAFTDAKGRKLGLVEAANGGTLFLDEIGELPLPAQSKLLKLLEDKTMRRLGSVRERRVNARIIAASNRDMESAVREGQFRSDLFFRLGIVRLHVPPLRERGEDVLQIAQHFLGIQSRRYRRAEVRLGEDAEKALRHYLWPGNVRELRNVIEHAVLLSSGDTISADRLARSSLPVPNQTSSSSWTLPADGVDLESVEAELVRQALERESWNVTRAARLLGLSRDTLRYRMEKYGLRREDDIDDAAD